ncbi:MAG TPA: hypothetical protein GX709_00375 [Clostridiales bacterium]|nr:hypothetical protein [Clostridiales bacterium]
MKVKDLILKLNAKTYNLADDDLEISTGYCGDFLSFVMGKAQDMCAWFTIMNNVNVAAVAHICNIATVVICEGIEPDDMLIEKCKAMGINLIGVEADIFNAVKLSKI